MSNKLEISRIGTVECEKKIMKEEKGCGRSRTYDRGPEAGEYREAGSLEQVSIEKAALSRHMTRK